MKKPLRWYNSIAVKSCPIAFVATHIPLIAVIVLQPGWLSPLGVFLTALAFTLAATALVIAMLWRMFQPLRAAADGLNGFMSRGLAFSGTPASSDEIGRLLGVLVQSLAHLDRGRSPLLYSGAMALDQASAEAGPGDSGPSGSRQWFALLEIDQWQTLDREGRFEEMLHILESAQQAVEERLAAGEYTVPWGRGRLLASLAGSGADASERLSGVCGNILAGGAIYTATAVMEPQMNETRARAAALQRLEQKLFAARMDGLQAAVA